jgi:hypothetical protein
MFGAAPPMQKPSKKTEPGSERFVLANGLTVILRPIKGTDSTALVVLYSIGNDRFLEPLLQAAKCDPGLFGSRRAGRGARMDHCTLCQASTWRTNSCPA